MPVPYKSQWLLPLTHVILSKAKDPTLPKANCSVRMNTSVNVAGAIHESPAKRRYAASNRRAAYMPPLQAAGRRVAHKAPGLS